MGMIVERTILEGYYRSFTPELQRGVDDAAREIVRVKREGRRVAVILEDRLNVIEGVTILVAELMSRGVIDAVLTSAAIVNHEMSGVLDRVKQVRWRDVAGRPDLIPRDGLFEVTLLSAEVMEQIRQDVDVDISFYRALLSAPGDVVVQAAGGRAYPGGFRTDVVARNIGTWAKKAGVPFEQMVGYGADSMTMIGAGARLGLPVLVTVPNLMDGGSVGLAAGDSIPLSERACRIGRVVDGTALVIESAASRAGDVYGGPFETFTGEGLWTGWQGGWTYCDGGRTVLRIRPADGTAEGPETADRPSVAARPGENELVGDIGKIWAVLAVRVADALGMELAFMNYSPSSPEGEKVCQWIVNNILPADGKLIRRAAGVTP